MKILKKLPGITLLLTTLLFTSCDKEKDPGNAITPAPEIGVAHKCRLIKVSEGSYDHNYFYDNSGKVIKINQINLLDTSSITNTLYTYNAAGKVIEEVVVYPGNLIFERKVFFYNANNLISRIEIQRRANNAYHLIEYYLFQYNSAGQRTLFQHYAGSQPGVLDRYTEYIYYQNSIIEQHYNALTIPATLVNSMVLEFDNKNSPFHELGYLHDLPEFDKHNIVSIRGLSGNDNPRYEYNNLDYPTKRYRTEELVIGEIVTTFKYACH